MPVPAQPKSLRDKTSTDNELPYGLASDLFAIHLFVSKKVNSAVMPQRRRIYKTLLFCCVCVYFRCHDTRWCSLSNSRATLPNVDRDRFLGGLCRKLPENVQTGSDPAHNGTVPRGQNGACLVSFNPVSSSGLKQVLDHNRRLPHDSAVRLKARRVDLAPSKSS